MQPTNQHGMTLIELVVTMGIMAITLVLITGVLSDQNEQAARFADELARLDVQRNLSGVLADGTVCDSMINNAPAFQFDPMNLSNVTTPAFATIPARSGAGAPSALIGNGVAVASTLSTRVLASNITITEVNCAIAPCTPISNQFNAVMQVTFDPTKTKANLAPLKFPITLSTSGAAGSQQIQRCRTSTGKVSRVENVDPTESCGGSRPNCPAAPITAQAACSPGYAVTGCGYVVSTWAPTPNDNTGTITANFHSNTPDNIRIMNNGTGNGCEILAGQAPGCGVCFKPQAICIKVQ